VPQLGCLPVDFGFFTEERPDRYRNPHAQVVQVFNHLGRVWVPLLFELERVPPVLAPVHPVLDDDVDGYPFALELPRDLDDLLLAGVPLLRLPVAERVLGEERRLAGQPPVAGDHPVERGPVDEVVVERVARFEPHLQPPVAELEHAHRVDVPEQAVPPARHHEGDRDVRVPLSQVHHPPPVVQAGVGAVSRVLAQPEHRFAVGQREHLAGAQCLLAEHLDLLQASIQLHQRVPAPPKLDRARAGIHYDLQLVGLDHRAAALLLYGERNIARLLHDDKALRRLLSFRRQVGDPYDVRGVNRDDRLHGA